MLRIWKKKLKTKKFYTSISMKPIMIKKELPGYLSDRLQEAADKITLMSPEAFASPRSHQAIKIKKEPKVGKNLNLTGMMGVG